ncbi:paralemmin-3 [Bufo bufo]|uniref:paralemmin-3 n=1 Tax=Bufo bufo TaxID=8384 RepID=UPI001ABE4A30|nr:paralemmin-3 [Bufo bufo]
MGETQIYSQRLHGINEKRRILGEVDVIQRELELQKVKLQQLKRKSLRDRWLMDGLVPSPGAEIENPLSETEDNIKKLEDELKSLQLQLVCLENPELKIENLKKHQGSDSHKPIVNGDQTQQISDQKNPTPSRREIQQEHKVIQEEDVQPNGEEEKHGENVDQTQKDPTVSKEVVVGHPTAAPRGIRVSGNQMEKNQDQSSPDQKLEIVDQRNEEEHDKEIQNINHRQEPQDDTSENLGSNKELKAESLDQEHTYTDQNSECLDKRLELEEENLEHLTKGLEHVDLNFNAESPKVDVSQPSLSNEGIMNDSDMVKVLVLEKIELHEDETQPSPIIKKQDEPSDNSQGGEEKPVSVSIVPNQDEEITVPCRNQDQNVESALSRCQEEPLDLVPVLIGHDKGEDLESNSYTAHQSLVILSSNQEQSTKLPCNDPNPSLSLPCEDLTRQVQISQVVVISAPGNTSSGELSQHSSQLGPSTDLNRPGTTEASSPAESQPLLHKPTETDAQSGPHGTNTAETRDKNPPVKKKSCQCCVVM